MRVLIVLPRQERATGNEVTAARYGAGLAAHGHEVRLERVAPGDAALLRAVADAFAPDLIHLLHAYRSGRPWLEAGLEKIPVVVTLTGTDIYGGIEAPQEGPVIRSVLARVAGIITQNRLTAAALLDTEPELAARVVYLPPGIILGSAPSPLERSALVAQGHCFFLHPAGIRPVKGNLELLHLFDPLAAAGLPLVVAFCGPLLDPEYGALFLAGIAARPWAHYLGVIPPAAIPATLCQADVILNNSQSEGLPNALLEAAALGKAMLVREIPGNCAVVDVGVNGLLYHDPPSFARQARALIASPELRRRLGAPRADRYSPEEETLGLITLYSMVITAREGAANSGC